MCSSLPAHNPCVPFTAYIPGGVTSGTRFIIRGMMPYTANLFTIDFKCGPRQNQDDTAFHLSIRPSEYCIVRNSLQCYNWGAEERYGSCPIARGQSYDMEITAEYSYFTVRINGQHFCNFNHRIAMERITHVHIGGDTGIYYIGREGGSCYGGAQPPTIAVCPPQVIIAPQPAHHHRPGVGTILGAAAVGSVIGALASGRPGGHHHHHHHHGHGHGPFHRR